MTDEEQASTYKTIVADPPWPYKNPGEFTKGGTPIARGAGSVARYGGMPIDELKALGVEALADANAHMYLWTTNAFLLNGVAGELMEAWGFRPITVLTWMKTTSEGVVCKGCKEFALQGGYDLTEFKESLEVGTIRASGRTGYYYRGATEHCIFGVRGSLKLTTDDALPTGFLWPRKGDHSVKPEAFYDTVEHASPGPYLELFARRNRLGWDTWGNESLEHVELEHTETVLGEDNVVELKR